MLTLCTSG